ncbi:MAG: rane protein of unknown function, partial [Modestobacter sp.]|nr:rane protein of unknown function [Modestobacter sp.]
MSTAATAQPGTWITVGVLIGMALTLLVGILVGAAWRARRSRRAADRPSPALADPPPTDPEPAAPAFAVDDLPGFLDRPPGWVAGPAVLPAAAPADRTMSPTTGSTAANPVAADSTAADSTGANPSEEAAGRHSAPTSATAPPVGGDLGRGGTLGIAASVLLIIAAVVVAFAGGSSGASATPVGAATDVTAPARSATPGPGWATPTTQGGGAAASSAAGDLAMISVPLGRNGVAASVTFQGVVLEQRAVGL